MTVNACIDLKHHPFWETISFERGDLFTKEEFSDALEFHLLKVIRFHQKKYFVYSRKIDAGREREYLQDNALLIRALVTIYKDFKSTGLILREFEKKLPERVLKEVMDDFHKKGRTFRI